MARVKSGKTNRARHKKVLKRAKGYYSAGSRCYIHAVEKNDHALQYAYRDRKVKKRNFRALWIQRINAAARMEGMSYSQLMGALHKSGIAMNRKVLADLAMNHPEAFKAIVKKAAKTK